LLKYGCMSIPLQQEYQFFLSHLDDFIPNHLNEFVLIKGEQIVNFFKSYEDALKEGLTQFGNVPFFIKIVKKEEEVHFFHQGLS
jgi:hypothetical protein